MNKKIFLTLLLTLVVLLALGTYSFAATNAGNMVKNAGNTVGSAISGITGAAVDGTRNLSNSAGNMMGSLSNANGDMENDATNTLADNDGMFSTNNDNYTATRTATTGNNNLLGMSDTTWTWLILGIVGLAIVGLVWYYGAQYEHRNYSND